MQTQPILSPVPPLVNAKTVVANGSDWAPPQMRANILLVDDRPDKLLALESVLGSLGHNIVKAQSGKDALRELLKCEFAVILLDVSMPGMDGFETAALIRERESSANTPIIFVTAYGNSDNHIAQGYSLGAVDYLLTPVIPEILRTKVSVLVRLHEQTALIKRQGEELRRAEEARHQRELADVADRLETETRRNRFFTLAQEMLGIADFNGRLLHLNASWHIALGYTDDELRSVTGMDLVHPDDADNLSKGLNAVRNGSPLPYFEGRFRHKDGSYRWLGGTATPFMEEKLIYIFVRDITPRKNDETQIQQLNQELEQRVAALTEANSQLEAFNYSIAHDLRTPLRSMSGFANALVEDEAAGLSTAGVEYARRIARSAKYMDAMLLDMLAYSRLSRADIVCEPVSLDHSVRETLSLMDKEIRDRGVKVELGEPLAAVFAHPPTLKQIISNLLSNAIKFTDSSRAPVLRIYTTKAGQRSGSFLAGSGESSSLSPDTIRFWVEDNGIGVPPEFQQKIFGLFKRLHDASAYPGTGVGLALVRCGTERMGGRAGVESEPGRGSRFWVDLPAATIPSP
jgi:PAS domain S-box-containing protein